MCENKLVLDKMIFGQWSIIMIISEMIKKIESNDSDSIFARLYGDGAIEPQKKRYIEAVNSFAELYGNDRDIIVCSVPGRSEISGNHTDHNCGKVIAAAIDLDIIAVASANDGAQVRVKSEGFPCDECRSDSDVPDGANYFTSGSIISGMCKGLREHGYISGGFDAYTTSSVLKGSGLSSSAAFEVMIGTILNHLYNSGRIGNPEIARIAQYAENVWFGKPCGLMDQTACAVGGFSAIDFEDPEKAYIEKIDFDLREKNYVLCITDTGGNHADLNAEYASLPAEMKAVANEFGKPVLRGLEVCDIMSKASCLREKLGDRAILRALHFINENKRVDMQVKALKAGDIESFLDGVMASGRSSFMWLQNVYTTKNPSEQGLSLALCITELALSDTSRKSAWRVHGGGFAGTIQAFVPEENVFNYIESIDSVFGKGACKPLSVRLDGAIKVF